MEKIEVRTQAHAEFRDVTAEVRACVAHAGIQSGAAHIFVPHTTAGVTINENADPDVVSDMLASLEKLVPWRQAHFRHAEGNSAAHIKSSLTGFAQTVPIENGALQLGTWQGIYFCEFDGPRQRQLWVQCTGVQPASE